jgi:aminopeptidase N
MRGKRNKSYVLIRDAFNGVPFLMIAVFILYSEIVSAQSRYLIFPERSLADSNYSVVQKSGVPLDAEPQFDSTHSFDALHYKLNLVFPMQGPYYYGSMSLRLRAMASLRDITLDMSGYPDIFADSVFHLNTAVDFIQAQSTLNILLPHIINPSDTSEITVYFHKNNAGIGYFYYERNAYTLTEPSDARYWFPCFDEPWDKATSELYATVPENMLVASNGVLESAVNNPADHTTTFHWINRHQIATYLMSFIIGEMASWTDYYIDPGNDSLPIYNICWREDSAKAAYDWATVPDMISIYSNLFGPYPFDKYGQGAVQPFSIGGMENQTMTVLNRTWITGDRFFEFGVAHELAHMWWGDNVTLSDWPHIWLNEGFATYASALYNEFKYGEESFAENMIEDANTYFDYDRIAGRYPLYDPPELFGIPEYSKGSWVLHMLRGVIGDDSFFAGLREYGRRYAYGNASTLDFQQAMEEISHRDLNWFFNEWIYDQGYPEYAYAWNDSAAGDSFLVHLEIAQFQNDAPIFEMPLAVRIETDSVYDISIANNTKFSSYDFAVKSKPFRVILDPDNWVLKKARDVSSDNHPGLPIPNEYKITGIYPNPFNSQTTIEIELSFSAEIELQVYDVLGRAVKKIFSGRLYAGTRLLTWDGRGEDDKEVSSGTYFIMLSAKNQHSDKKVVFIK